MRGPAGSLVAPGYRVADGAFVVKLLFRDQEFHVAGGMTLRKALEKCKLDPHVVLAVRQGKLITEDVILQDGEEIKLVAVISGG